LETSPLKTLAESAAREAREPDPDYLQCSTGDAERQTSAEQTLVSRCVSLHTMARTGDPQDCHLVPLLVQLAEDYDGQGYRVGANVLCSRALAISKVDQDKKKPVCESFNVPDCSTRYRPFR